MSGEEKGKRNPGRNIEAIVRHILAIDYAEMKLEEKLSKIEMPRRGLKEGDYLRIITQLKNAYEEYRNHIRYHLNKAHENIQKLRETQLRDAVERAPGCQNDREQGTLQDIHTGKREGPLQERHQRI